MRCLDKVAIITGAAGRGMGRSIALTLAREGARVVINYRTSEESAAAIVDHIASRGGHAVAVRADVFDGDDCAHLVERTLTCFGQTDICVVGPGGGWHPESPDQLDPPAALQDAHRELAPIYHLMPLVLPGMYERKWGRFIAISLAPPYTSLAYAYNVAKAARTHALLLARDEAWRNGVTLNVIAPSPVKEIDTLGEAIEQCAGGPSWKGRETASPQDIAEGVAFLCSEAGRFVSGCVLPYLF